MKLTVRQAASMLAVPEAQVYRWVDADEIPFVMISQHPRFHRTELLEWALERELPIAVDLYEGSAGEPFARALERGGGHVLDGGLAELGARLPIDDAADRELVRDVLASRDVAVFVRRASDDIAIPRAHSPIICPQTDARVTVWWCARSLAINGVATTTLFVILAPTIAQHLQLLSRLALALHDDAFRAAAQRAGDFDRAVAEARRWEHALVEPAP